MDLKALPKAEIHRHLELCLRHETIKELAPQFGIELKTQKDFESRFLILEPMQDLGTVLNKFLDTQKLLGSEEILERMAFEACEDAFVKEGIRIVEFRYAPTFIQQGHGFDFQSIHNAIVKGVERAEKKYPMAVGLICTLQRILPVEVAQTVMEFVVENRNTWVGIDLADNEVGFDSKPFRTVFARAKAAGLGITVHAGEADVPKAPEFVMDAIEILEATRIGHGLQIYRDPLVMDIVRDRDIVLELCPTSNVLTNVVSSLEKHPFRQLMDHGIRTTINTDDPSIFNTDLVREYQALEKHQKVTLKEFEQCAQWAAEASFIPLAKRKKVWPKPLAQ
jgi:adenosine deaminase